MTSILCSPIGLGRSGERVANTPSCGRDTSLRGWTRRMSRRARWNQVSTKISSPGSIPSIAGSMAGSKTIRASGAPSSPCFGAEAGSVSGDSTVPIGMRSKPIMVLSGFGGWIATLVARRDLPEVAIRICEIARSFVVLGWSLIDEGDSAKWTPGVIRCGSAGCEYLWRDREPAGLAEREAICLDARTEEGDLEGAVGDRPPLANQLVEPLLGHRSATPIVD